MMIDRRTGRVTRLAIDDYPGDAHPGMDGEIRMSDPQQPQGSSDPPWQVRPPDQAYQPATPDSPYQPGYPDPTPQYPATSGYPAGTPGDGTAAPPPGYPPAGYPMVVAAPPTNGMAIAALVVSIVGVFGLTCYGLGGYLGIVGAILGHISRKQVRERGENGDGMALAGIIVGWIAGAIAIIATLAIVGFIIWAVNQDTGY